MTSFILVQVHLDYLDKQYKRYRQRRQLSFILLGLTSIVILVCLHTHAVQLVIFSSLLLAGSLYLFITAEKLLNSIINALYTDTPEAASIRMNQQEAIFYVQMKTTLSYNISKAIDTSFLF